MRHVTAILLGMALTLSGCSSAGSTDTSDGSSGTSAGLDPVCVSAYEPYFAYAHMNLNQGIRSLLNDESAGFDSSLGASVATAAVRMTSASLAAGASPVPVTVRDPGLRARVTCTAQHTSWEQI